MITAIYASTGKPGQRNIVREAEVAGLTEQGFASAFLAAWEQVGKALAHDITCGNTKRLPLDVTSTVSIYNQSDGVHVGDTFLRLELWAPLCDDDAGS